LAEPVALQDQALSYNRAAEILSKITNKKISYVNSTDAEARQGMREKATDGWFINIALELYDSYRKGYSSISFAVESITGTKPRTFIGFTRIMLSISIKNFLVS
jgi:hypothetical protein